MVNAFSSSLTRRLCRALFVLGIVFSGCPARADDGYSFAEVKTLIEAGHYDEARKLVTSSGDGGQYTPVVRDFTEALILKHQGQLQASVEKMQKIVIAYPQFDRVRQELAHSYFLMGESEHAKYQFELLSSSSQSPVYRSFYNNYIDAINANRPWTLDGYIALAPTTNITNGVTADTVSIGGRSWHPENKKQSGIGLSYGASGAYQFTLADRLALAFGGNFDGVKYRDREFDRLSGQVFSELSYKTDDWRFGLGPTLERTSYAWEGQRFGYGVQGSVQRRMGVGGDTLRLTGRLRYLDYDDEDFYDGMETTVGLRYQHVFSSSLLVNLGTNVTFMDARKDSNAYTATRPYFEVYADLPLGILGSFGAGYEFRNHDGIFPGTVKEREDRQFDVSIGLTLRKLSYKGIAPRLEYGYLINSSNVDLYDYDSHNFGLYLTKKY